MSANFAATLARNSGVAPIPIIFITAHEDENCRRQALQAGAVAFLYKPFYEQELLNAIDAALKDPEDKH